MKVIGEDDGKNALHQREDAGKGDGMREGDQIQQPGEAAAEPASIQEQEAESTQDDVESADDLRTISQRKWEEASERLRYSIEFSQLGLKWLFILNGGAMLGLLTFVSNRTDIEPKVLVGSFLVFSTGILTALLSTALAYASQGIIMAPARSDTVRLIGYDRFPKDGAAKKAGNRIALASLVFAVISVGCFTSGAITALYAL